MSDSNTDGDDDSGPSTLLVVGTVVVAGMVLLAAVVFVVAPILGTFVLGVGGDSAGGESGELGGGFDSEISGISFSISYEDGEATVEHNNGDRVEPGNLTLTYGNQSATWAELAGSSDTVEPGDAVSITVESGTRLEIVYDGGDEEIILYSGTIE